MNSERRNKYFEILSVFIIFVEIYINVGEDRKKEGY